MTRREDGLYAAMLRGGMSRRSFLKFSAVMAGVLALPATYAPRIAAAVAAAPRIPVIWLRGQDCAGNTEALLRAVHPTVPELLLDVISLEYHETLMAPAGAAADLSRTGTMEKYPDGYIAVVEGGIPLADEGAFCTIGGRAFRDIVREVCDGALFTIAAGSCASYGGLPAAGGGPTGAVGVAQVASSARLVNLPGCPLNVDNLTATIVHYQTFNELPPRDAAHRPFFAYGGLIHNQCERRAHYEFGEYVLAWGDEGAQKGWCLYKMGCKGPETFANCPTARYGDGTSWPVKAGHGCTGCTMPGHWDAMSPFYRRLPQPVPFLPQVTVDNVGQALVGGVVALTAVHGTATVVRGERANRANRRAVARAAGPGDGPAATAGAAVATAPDETTLPEATVDGAPAAEAEGEAAPDEALDATHVERPVEAPPEPAEPSSDVVEPGLGPT